MFVVLPAAPAVARAPELGRPNLWFAAGSVDEAELKRLVRELIAATATKGRVTGTTAEKDALPAGYTVRTGAGVVAELGDDPLQESAERLFWVAVLGAGVLALLAVLLTLVRAAPERAALLARLRTMGLRPRQGLFLILVETLPQTLVAAVGGGLVAVAAVALLGPAFDLSTLVGAAIPAGLPVTVPPVLLQTVGLAALVSAGVVAEALVSGRRQIATELRAGDQQ
ncbi:FtsX-like permease family protein [Kitasatospora sp. NPDC001574]